MTTKKSETSSNTTPESTGAPTGISLDWWAVIFALALAALVFAGLQANW
jgi:hypothetical protein